MEKTEMDNYESGSSYESPFDVATIGWPVIDGVKYRVSVHGINAKGGTSIPHIHLDRADDLERRESQFEIDLVELLSTGELLLLRGMNEKADTADVNWYSRLHDGILEYLESGPEDDAPRSSRSNLESIVIAWNKECGPNPNRLSEYLDEHQIIVLEKYRKFFPTLKPPPPEQPPLVDGETIPGTAIYSLLRRDDALSLGGNLVSASGKGRHYEFSAGGRFRVLDAIREALRKFAVRYFSELHDSPAIIALPSGDARNNQFAVMFRNVAEELGHTVIPYEHSLRNISTDEFREMVFEDPTSDFNAWLSWMSSRRQIEKVQMLEGYLAKMDSEHHRLFSLQYVSDPEIREHVIRTMKARREFADIMDRNVLLMDHQCTQGQSIEDACEKLDLAYRPRSVVALTLFPAEDGVGEPTPWVCDGITILDGLPSPQYRNLYQLFMDANSAQRESFLASVANQVPDRRRRKTPSPTDAQSLTTNH